MLQTKLTCSNYALIRNIRRGGPVNISTKILINDNLFSLLRILSILTKFFIKLGPSVTSPHKLKYLKNSMHNKLVGIQSFISHKGPQGQQRYSSTLFLTSVLEGGEGSASRPGRTLPPGKPGTHCTGCWVGLRAGLDLCGKSHPQRISITGRSSPQAVAIPIKLPGPLHNRLTFSNSFFFRRTPGTPTKV